MRITVERLRLGILVVAGLLVTGILLFFGYARWQVRRIGRDLPAKLGISIQRSSDGFTFSKSNGPHTLFTVHAAKMLQYKDGGHAELHDVSITLFNEDGTQADRIYGNDFDYDPGNGVVRANGDVQIDLDGPGGAGSGSAAAESADDSKNIVHVKTSDLVFNQKTGQADTSQGIEFHIAQAAGSATGASLDSHTGVLILKSDVDFESSMNGSPLAVRARHAEFDRASRQLYLLESRTNYAQSHGSSDQATVHFRPDGSAYRVDAVGHVIMTSDTQKVTSSSAHFDLDEKSQPRQAILEGGVLYAADDAARRLNGSAAAGTLTFGPQAMVRHAQLRDAVSVVDQEKTSLAKPQGGKQQAKTVESTTRDVEAAKIDVDFAPTPDRKPVAQRILANGGARLNIRTLYANTPPEQTSVQGDQLFVTLRNGVALETLRGTGHTKLAVTNPNGVKQTSTGDNLLMTFAAPVTTTPAKGKQSAPPGQAAQLQSSEQEGNVVLIQESPARPGSIPGSASGSIRGSAPNPSLSHGAAAPDVTTATAQRAVYDAATQLVKLFGNPQIRDVAGTLTAAAIEFERGSGNATATGGVKATYQSSTGASAGPSPVNFGGSEPVHVVADHARLDHRNDLTFFYGKGGQAARLWQGADSISAPVLEISRTQQTLSAHGAGGDDAKAVEAVFTSLGGAAPGKAVQPQKARQSSVVRVTSRTLFYSDAESKAVFRGAVVAEDPSGTTRANAMDVFLSGNGSQPAAMGPAKPRQARQVERIVARGEVQLDQPGRKGTGDQLVYTAQDGNFLLTGSNAAPPLVVDQVHGTLTGASLIFNDRDDSVMVNSGQIKAVTETHTAK